MIKRTTTLLIIVITTMTMMVTGCDNTKNWFINMTKQSDVNTPIKIENIELSIDTKRDGLDFWYKNNSDLEIEKFKLVMIDKNEFEIVLSCDETICPGQTSKKKSIHKSVDLLKLPEVKIIFESSERFEADGLRFTDIFVNIFGALMISTRENGEKETKALNIDYYVGEDKRWQDLMDKLEIKDISEVENAKKIYMEISIALDGEKTIISYDYKTKKYSIE